METFYCSNCGAPIESNLRFCRKCGQPINFSEATTRTLDPPSVIEPATQHMNPAQTGPSYLPPGAILPMPAQTTTGLRPSGQNRIVLILAGLVGFLLIALIILGIIASRISREVIPDRPAIQPPPPATSVPPVSSVPQAPVLPPLPPPSPTAPGNPSISRAMVYPGATINMEMNRAGGGSVLQLQTTDPYDKVVAWYTAKLRPSKTIRTVGNTTILRGAEISAIINGGDDGVTILLREGKDKD